MNKQLCYNLDSGFLYDITKPLSIVDKINEIILIQEYKEYSIIFEAPKYIANFNISNELKYYFIDKITEGYFNVAQIDVLCIQHFLLKELNSSLYRLYEDSGCFSGCACLINVFRFYQYLNYNFLCYDKMKNKYTFDETFIEYYKKHRKELDEEIKLLIKEK